METTGGIEIDTTNSVSSDTEILKKRKHYFPKPPNPEILKRHGQSQWDKVEENWEEEERAEYEHDPEADDNEENDENDEDDEKDEEDKATTNSREYKRYATTVSENEPTSGQSHSISRPVSRPVSRSVSHPVSRNASRAASHLLTRPPTRPVSPALPVPVPSTTDQSEQSTSKVRKSKANSEKSTKDPTKLSFYTPQAKKVITGSQMFMHRAMVLEGPFLTMENHETLLFDCLTHSIKERGEKGLHVEEGYIEEHKEDIITF
ncbi:hypothetical protein F5876DRAFT_71312, partial [Lentinula aff. lateritia]